MAEQLPRTHAELDAIAEENDYDWPEEDMNVVAKQEALVDEGLVDLDETDEEDDEATAKEPDDVVAAADDAGSWKNQSTGQAVIYPEGTPEEDKEEPMSYEEQAAEAEESTEPHRLPLLTEGTWVILGHGDNIPEEIQGHEAVVVDAPMHLQLDPDEFSNRPYQYQNEDDIFTVKTRDQYSATITAKREDFETISTTGRVGLPSPG